jgi:serine/threonine-protein kinase
MAPEQLHGQRLTPACDMYALGLIGWEMLIGHCVFAGKPGPEILYLKMMTHDGFPLDDANIPSSLAGFIQACTRADPLSRPTAADGVKILDGLKQ